MRLSRVVTASVVLLAVAGIVVGLLTGFLVQVGGLLLGPRTQAGSPAERSALPDPAEPTAPSESSASSPTSASASPGPSATEPALPAPVLRAADEDIAANPARIKARITTVGAAPGRAGVEVVDGTGKVVYSANAKAPLIPASTTKLLTSAAALQLFGPEHRFRTKVVTGKGRQIILVGGGDPYLVPSQSAGDYPRRATLKALAATTATVLKAQQRRSVTLGYDDTLFSGPAWNPRWLAGYRDQTSPTAALWAVPKSTNPTANAVATFTTMLQRHGIKVTVGDRVKASRSARPIAAVQSMTVAQIVRHLLLVSDNNAAEVMFRQVGLKAGAAGSIAGGVRGVRATLTKLGVWTPGSVVFDGSGLARQNAIPPNTFAKLLRLAGTDDHRRLRGLLTGLPIAGVEGSLRTRFVDQAMHPADGLVLGKTGTLTGVRSLAGYLRAPDGTMLYYSTVVNGAKDDYAAEIWLQRVLVALSRCGCKK